MDPYVNDVFVSHSRDDADVARDIAQRLEAAGLTVWLNEWQGATDEEADERRAAIAQSRVLILCLSANALNDGWEEMQAATFHFREPSDDRRFVPLQLDDTPVPHSLAHFLCIDWQPEAREREFARLLEACRPWGQSEPANADDLIERRLEIGHTMYPVHVFSPDGSRVLTGGNSGVITVRDLESGKSLLEMEGHQGRVWRLALSRDGSRVLSSGADGTVRLWDTRDGSCTRVYRGHDGEVCGLAWSPDERAFVSGGWSDHTVRIWDVKRGKQTMTLEGHTAPVMAVAWSPGGADIVSAAGTPDMTLRVWDARSGACLNKLDGHTEWISDLALDFEGRCALTSAWDQTVRVWDLESGRCLWILQGHSGGVSCVAWSPDERYALSGAIDSTARVWDLHTGRCVRVLTTSGVDEVRSVAWSESGTRAWTGEPAAIVAWDLTELAAPEDEPARHEEGAPAQTQYTNAKVLLVGESGVGKTGLSNYLAQGIKVESDKPIPSTDGAWATQWRVPHGSSADPGDREIWLWDFAGQVDYRLVHQLFMDDTAAAVLVFNPQTENPFEGLGQWDRDLQKASRGPFAKLLVAGRVDRGGLVVSAGAIERFMEERGFRPPLHYTSARTGEGCEELRSAIVSAIDWNDIPQTTSPAIYEQIKREILRLRDSGIVLIRLSELKQRIDLLFPEDTIDLAALKAVITLLSSPGMIQRLDFGSFILLRPEVLSRYAAALIRKVRQHPQELGCIAEDELLAGDLDYQDFERLPPDDESVILQALDQTLVSRAWCIRQTSDQGTLLTFPSYFRRERPFIGAHPHALVTYRFAGSADEIYASLVARLNYTNAFDTDELWREAASFKTQAGAGLGLQIDRESEGTYRLECYFAAEVDDASRVLFLRYVHEHLREHGRDVVRLRHYFCANRKCDAFGEPFGNQAFIDKALEGSGKVFCPACGKAIRLRDALEERFSSPQVAAAVRQLREQGQVVIDNESRELILVGHAFAIAGEAGQIYRNISNSDHGIDGEIEFKDDDGRASGCRLYLQLKSGDSYLTKRKRDGAEVFTIKNPRWSEYWMQQAYPVMLVIRQSDGSIRWMDVSAYLRREHQRGKVPVKQIVFDGTPFDALHVRLLRERVLGEASRQAA
jgi:WD40 repeat protein